MTTTPSATREDSPSASFSFEAQTVDGQSVSGTIDAPDADQATRRLQSLRLRVLQVASASPRRRAALGRTDFFAFNQQLAQLTQAGIPIERGLRLVAQDMRTSRLRNTVNEVAAELERGTPLAEAFDHHRAKFPPLYSRLIDAGVRSGNLPGVLLNLGRHLELVTRLRGALWRAVSYPFAVAIGLLIVLMFLSVSVIPQFEKIFREFGMELPGITRWLLTFPQWMPYVAGALLAVIMLPVLFWPLLRMSGKDQFVLEHALFPLPMIGGVLKRSTIARWCDALALGVDAGLDLPASLDLAGDAVASPKLQRDGRMVSSALQKGEPLDRAGEHTTLLPATVLAGIELASQNHDLAATLETMGRMYRQQAEVRISSIPTLLMPLLLMIVALFIGMVVLALFAPLVSLLQAITG